jgi:hypothetical protein
MKIELGCAARGRACPFRVKRMETTRDGTLELTRTLKNRLAPAAQ